MKTLNRILAAVLVLSLVAGCLPSGQASESPTPVAGNAATAIPGLDADAVATQVAAAIILERTQSAATIASEVQMQVGTAVAAELTRIAQVNPTETTAALATGIPTAIPRQDTPTATSTIPAIVNPEVDYLVKLVSDVTIPDGTQVVSGQKFVKTWRIQNIGKLEWTTEFAFVFINGERMEGQAILLPNAVPSGGTIDISIEMQAPAKAGPYTGYWGLQTTDDALFGIGETGTDFLTVVIEAVAPTATPTATTAPAATPTP